MGVKRFQSCSIVILISLYVNNLNFMFLVLDKFIQEFNKPWYFTPYVKYQKRYIWFDVCRGHC